MAALSLASLWTCSYGNFQVLLLTLPSLPAILLSWLEYPSSITFHHGLSYQHADSLPSPVGISFPSFLWISACVPPSTHTHIHTHTLSHSLMLLKPEINYVSPANLSFTMSQQYFHDPYFDLHYFTFVTRSLQLHTWLPRVNVPIDEPSPSWGASLILLPGLHHLAKKMGTMDTRSNGSRLINTSMIGYTQSWTFN